jgi:RNA polymerase sigma-70 factor (ECF subfamily)
MSAMADFNDYNQSWMAADSEFETTEWTQILGASLSKEVMGELYKKYRKPVYLYLRSKGFPDDTARDLIQGFFTEKILGKQLLQKADPRKGKFRAFLLTAIRNYTIDIKRSERPTVSFSQEKHDQYASGDDPALAFNQAWAIQFVQDTVAELEDECLKQGKQQDWELFRLWLLEPDLEHGKVTIDELCRQLKIKTPDRAYSIIFNLKERFRAIFRGRLRAQGYSPSEITEEIKGLLSVFSKNPKRI